MKSYVKYKRVSSRGQVDQYGLDGQDELITAFADANGYICVNEFVEEAVSGTTEFDDRESWVAMLEWLAANAGVTTIIVSDLSRLARDLMVQETLLADIQKRGFEAVSVREPDLCSNDPSRKLIRQVIGAINEYDRAMIVARLRLGRMTRAKTGERGTGGMPLGYKRSTDSGRAKTVIDERESEVVAKAHYLRHTARLSLQGIADWLNANDYKPKNWTETKPTRFYGSTVRKILGRRLYHGETSFKVDANTRIHGNNASLRIV